MTPVIDPGPTPVTLNMAAAARVLRLRSYRLAADMDRHAGIDSLLPAVIADLEFAIVVRLAALQIAHDFTSRALLEAPQGSRVALVTVEQLETLRAQLWDAIETERLRSPIVLSDSEARSIVRARLADAALGQEVDQELLDAVCALVPSIEQGGW